MRLTAKEVSERTGMSYIVASGLLAYLKNVGKATVEKRISGKGRPTLIYAIDQHTVFDFGVASEPAIETDPVEAALARLRQAQSEAA